MHYQTLLGPDPNEVNSGRCSSIMPTALSRCHQIGLQCCLLNCGS